MKSFGKKKQQRAKNHSGKTEDAEPYIHGKKCRNRRQSCLRGNKPRLQKRVGQLYGKIKSNERDSQKEILCCKSKKCPWQKHCADAQNGKSIHQCNDNGQ